MSIQWNKEISVADVAKFFNQEIDMKPVEKLFTTEIDLNKCAQVAAMVAIFGVIPAFTYGTVLGTLEGQRVALLTDVTSLQAEVLMSARSIVSAPRSGGGGSTAGTSTIISSVRTDKEVYTAGSPVQLTFYSLVPASTTNIYQISLHTPNGALVHNLATMSPYQGPNRYNFTIATSTLEKGGDAFVVRVTATRYNQSADSNKFVVNRNQVRPRVTLVSSTAVIQDNVAENFSDDQGLYNIVFDVVAGDQPMFIKLEEATRGAMESTSGINYFITSAAQGNFTATTSGSVSSILTREAGGTVEGKYLKLNPGQQARLRLTVYFDPSITNLYRMQLHSLKYNIVAANPNQQIVFLPMYNYQTNAIAIQNGVTAESKVKVSLNKITSVGIAGDSTFAQSDIGVFRFSISVSAPVTNIYIPKESKDSTGFFFALTTDTRFANYQKTIFTKWYQGDTDKYYFIPKGSTRVFDITEVVEPMGTGEYGMKLVAIKWGESADKWNQYELAPQFKSEFITLIGR